MQVCDSRTSGWRPPEDARKIFVPEKMVTPSVPPRMKEGCESAGHGINRCDMGELMAIAALTGEREIVELVRASQNAGMDMLNRKVIRRVIRGRQAVFTDAFGPVINKLLLPGRRPSVRHKWVSRYPAHPSRHPELSRAGLPVPADSRGGGHEPFPLGQLAPLKPAAFRQSVFPLHVLQ